MRMMNVLPMIFLKKNNKKKGIDNEFSIRYL